MTSSGYSAASQAAAAAAEVCDLLTRFQELELARAVRDVVCGMSERERRIVVFGDFNRGKSTLINAVLGRRVMTSKMIPTTGVATYIKWGEVEDVLLEWRDGKHERRGLEELQSISVLDANGNASDELDRITVFIRSPVLKPGLVIIDTPGVNEAASQSRRAERALRHADFVLWLLDARECLKQHERETATNWVIAHPNVPVIPIVNFMNMMADEMDRVEVRCRLRDWLQEHLGEQIAMIDLQSERPYLEINARAAMRHVCDGLPPPNDDFELLRNTMTRIGNAVGADIARCSRRSHLNSVCAAALEYNEFRMSRLEESKASYDQAKARSVASLLERRGRIQESARVHSQMLVTAAEMCFDGAMDGISSWGRSDNDSVNPFGIVAPGEWIPCVPALFLRQARRELGEPALRWYEAQMAGIVSHLQARVETSLRSIAQLHMTSITAPEIPAVALPQQVSFTLKWPLMPKGVDVAQRVAELAGGAGLVSFLTCGFPFLVMCCIPYYVSISALVFAGVCCCVVAITATTAEYVAEYRRIAMEGWEAARAQIISSVVYAFESATDGFLRVLDAAILEAKVESTEESEVMTELNKRRRLDMLVRQIRSTC